MYEPWLYRCQYWNLYLGIVLKVIGTTVVTDNHPTDHTLDSRQVAPMVVHLYHLSQLDSHISMYVLSRSEVRFRFGSALTPT